MFNDYNGFKDFDAYINGFSFMSNDALLSFIDHHGLSFSLEQITYIRDYFRNEKKMFPTYNQIFFFNEINKIRKAQKKGYSIYSAIASCSVRSGITKGNTDNLFQRRSQERTRIPVDRERNTSL